MQKIYIKSNNTKRRVIIVRYSDELFDISHSFSFVFIPNISVGKF